MQHDVQLSPDGSILTVSVPMTFRKRGGRKVVISPAGTPQQASLPSWAKPRSGVDEALVKTVAQAFHFQRLLDEGCYATISDLAKAKRLDQSFVSRILKLTLLAPDIVEAILDGKQSPPMQRQKLLRGFPREWEEQRAMWFKAAGAPVHVHS
jgi:Lhr-like helicase